MLDHEFTCADCGKASPPTEESETVTKRHGWRIARQVVAGVVIFEARCPDCYARYRTSLPPSSRPGRGSTS